jgi:(E)-4-hydroxy-3-methylbut-2-enyl-diphosphate synthase
VSPGAPSAWTRSPWRGLRRGTREVRVGDVGIGGANPIRVQSMTTTNTLDTRATCDQIERLAAAGCELARVTAPSLRDAENLAAIAAELRRRRVRIPLVADIHFTPNAALLAAEHVEKVRINPGNYADKKKFAVREYTDAEYAAELERVAARFRPLVRRCRELGRALRIGTNHGSLSDRVLNRYGDTPLGMVESALEFLDVCESEGFGDVVFSMKASNPQVAIQAYRLLAGRLAERGGRYPFHVGVTEAGDGEDGRIKSAIGIGALLEDGIGDTIRVSLTEDPVAEVPVAAALARRAEARWAADAARATAPAEPGAPYTFDPFDHARRVTRAAALGRAGEAALAFGAGEPVRVELDLGAAPADPAGAAARLATSLAMLKDVACEGLCIDAGDATAAGRAAALRAELARLGIELPLALRAPAEAAAALPETGERLVVEVSAETSDADLAGAARAARGRALEWLLHGEPEVLPALVDRAVAAAGEAAFSFASPRAAHAARIVAACLAARGAADAPIVLRQRRAPGGAEDAALLAAAVDLGAPLCDGIGDAVSLGGFADPGKSVDLAYRILQGARLRTSRTEYISCPSCGRTLFDLQETTARVKAKTEHLVGVKIAVMGCIVNGPGEMADADFGYVGSGPGVVNLYVGKEVVARAVPEGEAPDRLVGVIRDHGRWTEPA